MDYSCKNTKNLNLVLDLDETLIKSFDDLNEYKIFKDKHFNEFSHLENNRLFKLETYDITDKKGSCIQDNFCFITRPHLSNFLEWSLTNFRKVIIWSAGKHNYVHTIVENIFHDIQPDHVLTYNNIHITDSGFSKPLVFLKKLDNNITLKNTIIIDDLKTNFLEDNPKNAIHIPEFSPELNIKDIYKHDDCLQKIMKWFKNNDVHMENDIRKIDKSDIFH